MISKPLLVRRKMGPVIDILNIYTNPNARNFGETLSQVPDNVFTRFLFWWFQRKTCPSLDPKTVNLSKNDSCQTQGHETITDLCNADSSYPTSKSKWTVSSHTNLYKKHHQSRVTTLQRLNSMILQAKTFCKLILVIPEEANRACALIFFLSTRTEIYRYRFMQNSVLAPKA